ncbi:MULTISPECIES: hypothetical protein [Argonema]|uniref:hypothetical protein n=1 Tax=Argonema TaxID=2942761 RepID=UPI002011C2CF|nr:MULTISPECIES: hypothetical protein [Argonema]MCL1463291.1 hypothetical protein [Argonema galeatum A003/A1]MCL1473844.1 hypothetical protein [Argonema antarcticum A004/B2]
MAELTIQIPDELAKRLEPLQERLPELLWQVLENPEIYQPIQSEVNPNFTDIFPVYQEVIDFLIKSPTLEDIVAFQVSPQAQTRLQTLLSKNREATLTPPEVAELDVYEQLEHLMILLKARAYSGIN